MKEKLAILYSGALAVKFASVICKKCKVKLARKIQKHGIAQANEDVSKDLCNACIEKVRKLTEKHASKLERLKGGINKNE